MNDQPPGKPSRIANGFGRVVRFSWRECLAPFLVIMIFVGVILILVERGIIAERWRDALLDYFDAEIATIEPYPTYPAPPALASPPGPSPIPAAETLGYTIGRMMLEVRDYLPVMCAYINEHPADFTGDQAAPLHDQCAAFFSSDAPFYVEVIEAICPYPALVALLEPDTTPYLWEHAHWVCSSPATPLPW